VVLVPLALLALLALLMPGQHQHQADSGADTVEAGLGLAGASPRDPRVSSSARQSDRRAPIHTEGRAANAVPGGGRSTASEGGPDPGHLAGSRMRSAKRDRGGRAPGRGCSLAVLDDSASRQLPDPTRRHWPTFLERGSQSGGLPDFNPNSPASRAALRAVRI
jgi:hypothetical protein